MGELRSTFRPERESSASSDDRQDELRAIARDNRLKGSLVSSEISEQPSGSEGIRQQATIEVFGKPQEITYFNLPGSKKVVVEFINKQGSKVKTNFSAEEFKRRLL